MNKLFEINDYELLSKKVYRILKERIIKGDLAQGSKLFEAKIAKQLGVSRTPVREAIRELAAEGFVKISPNQGVEISNISIEDIQEVLQIRAVLEGLAAKFAATKITKEKIKELENFNKNMEKFISKDDISNFIKESEKFHGLILNIYGNNRLVQIRKNLDDQIHRYRSISLNIPGRLKHALEEHKKITEALKQGDLLKADELSKMHIENELKNILSYKVKNELE
jgi:DNA-binding GntR family transcriptional regulator